MSEENLVISTDDTAGSKQVDSMQQIGLSTAKVPYKLMSEMKNESIFDDLLQYACMCGPLNLRLVAADKWHQFKEIIEKDKGLANHNMNLSFLNELYVPKNKELGTFLDRLYNGPKEETLKPQLPDASAGKLDASKNSKEVLIDDGSVQGSQLKAPQSTGHVTDFPAHHPIKLCVIGRAYSGKSTQAKALQRMLGDKVTLFDMGQVVREALAYVDPSQAKEE